MTPQDIVRKEFREAFRGYNQTDVDLFLDEVVEELTRMTDENQKMRVRLAALQQELGRFREARSSRAQQQMASRYAELAPEEPPARAERASAPPQTPSVPPLRSDPPRAESPRSEPPRPETRAEPAPERRSAAPAEGARPAETPRPVEPSRGDRPDPFAPRPARSGSPPPASDPFRSNAPRATEPARDEPSAPPSPSTPSAPEPRTEPTRPVTERWTPPDEGGSFWDRER